MPSGKTLISLINEFNISADWLLTGKANNINDKQIQSLLEYYNKLDNINKRLAVNEMKHMYEVQELKKLED